MEQVTVFYDSIGALPGIRQLLADRVKESIYLELKTKKKKVGSDLALCIAGEGWGRLGKSVSVGYVLQG